jgi:hypothetical protein
MVSKCNLHSVLVPHLLVFSSTNNLSWTKSKIRIRCKITNFKSKINSNNHFHSIKARCKIHSRMKQPKATRFSNRRILLQISTKRKLLISKKINLVKIQLDKIKLQITRHLTLENSKFNKLKWQCKLRVYSPTTFLSRQTIWIQDHNFASHLNHYKPHHHSKLRKTLSDNSQTILGNNLNSNLALHRNQLSHLIRI